MSATIRKLQAFLNSKGYSLTLDGIDGPATERAWDAYSASLSPKPTIVTPAASGAYSDDFNKIFAWLMEWEGTTFENDPQDPGGATKYGIDQRSHPGVNIRALTEDQAKAIYWKEWNAEGCAAMSRPLSEVYFNFCVNTGQGRANKFLQYALGVTQDGVLGPKSLEALKKMDPARGALVMIDQADKFYVGLNKPRFLKGWLNRDASLREHIA